LKNQKLADERFKEKFNKPSLGYLDICPKCSKNNGAYIKNIIKKYGIYK